MVNINILELFAEFGEFKKEHPELAESSVVDKFLQARATKTRENVTLSDIAGHAALVSQKVGPDADKVRAIIFQEIKNIERLGSNITEKEYLAILRHLRSMNRKDAVPEAIFKQQFAVYERFFLSLDELVAKNRVSNIVNRLDEFRKRYDLHGYILFLNPVKTEKIETRKEEEQEESQPQEAGLARFF